MRGANITRTHWASICINSFYNIGTNLDVYPIIIPPYFIQMIKLPTDRLDVGWGLYNYGTPRWWVILVTHIIRIKLLSKFAPTAFGSVGLFGQANDERSDVTP